MNVLEISPCEIYSCWFLSLASEKLYLFVVKDSWKNPVKNLKCDFSGTLKKKLLGIEVAQVIRLNLYQHINITQHLKRKLIIHDTIFGTFEKEEKLSEQTQLKTQRVK